MVRTDSANKTRNQSLMIRKYDRINIISCEVVPSGTGPSRRSAFRCFGLGAKRRGRGGMSVRTGGSKKGFEVVM